MVLCLVTKVSGVIPFYEVIKMMWLVIGGLGGCEITEIQWRICDLWSYAFPVFKEGFL